MKKNYKEKALFSTDKLEVLNVVEERISDDNIEYFLVNGKLAVPKEINYGAYKIEIQFQNEVFFNNVPVLSYLDIEYEGKIFVSLSYGSERDIRDTIIACVVDLIWYEASDMRIAFKTIQKLKAPLAQMLIHFIDDNKVKFKTDLNQLRNKEIFEIPDSVKILGNTYKVRTADKLSLDEAPLLGVCTKYSRELIIANEQSLTTKYVTFLHEMFHGYFREFGLSIYDNNDTEEIIVERMANALIVLMKMNSFRIEF